MSAETATLPAETSTAQAPAQAQQPAGVLDVIERIALNPDAPLDRVEALLRMRAEEEDRQRRLAREDAEAEAKRAFLDALAEVQSEIGTIHRTQKNNHTNSMFADLADIDRETRPILAKHGFSTTAQALPSERDDHIRMRLVLGHREGHENVYEDEFPIDAAGAKGGTNKTAIQAKGSTQTYARRYLIASALNLSFADDNDGNRAAQAGEAINSDQVGHIKRWLVQIGGDEAQFAELLGVGRVEDIPAAQYNAAKTIIRAKADQEGVEI